MKTKTLLIAALFYNIMSLFLLWHESYNFAMQAVLLGWIFLNNVEIRELRKSLEGKKRNSTL